MYIYISLSLSLSLSLYPPLSLSLSIDFRLGFIIPHVSLLNPKFDSFSSRKLQENQSMEAEER